MPIKIIKQYEDNDFYIRTIDMINDKKYMGRIYEQRIISNN